LKNEENSCHRKAFNYLLEGSLKLCLLIFSTDAHFTTIWS